MVLPLADDNTGRRMTPFVNYALIAANIFVFVFLQEFGANDEFTYAFSTVPLEIVTGKDVVTPDRLVQDPLTGEVFRAPGLQPTPASVYLTLLTSMFMHGGIAHLLSNMLFLWIFGDDIEDALGHGGYLVFYLVCGVLSSLAHVFTVVGLEGADSAAALIPSWGRPERSPPCLVPTFSCIPLAGSWFSSSDSWCGYPLTLQSVSGLHSNLSTDLACSGQDRNRGASPTPRTLAVSWWASFWSKCFPLAALASGQGERTTSVGGKKNSYPVYWGKKLPCKSCHSRPREP